MAESPKISLAGESARLARSGIDEALDVWRHEGLKKSAEHFLYLMGRTASGRAALERIADKPSDPRLITSLGGIALFGPLGLAAGWDKTGRTILAWQALGVNHTTVGGVPYYPQPGNRMGRLKTFDHQVGDHGATKSLNALGFNSLGSAVVVHNVQRQRELGEVRIPVFMQATINKELMDQDEQSRIPGVLAKTVARLKPVADGISLGLSSPNTLGMRDSQAEDFLYEIIARVKEVTGDDMPLELKGDGDGGQSRLEMYCNLVERGGIDILGLINTTALSNIKAKYGAEDLPGGLAGADPDYQHMARDAVKYVYEAVGDKVDIVGMGGINSAELALRMIKNGASALAVNTAVRSLGMRTMKIIGGGLSQHPEVQKIRSLNELIGVDTTRGPKSNDDRSRD